MLVENGYRNSRLIGFVHGGTQGHDSVKFGRSDRFNRMVGEGFTGIFGSLPVAGTTHPHAHTMARSAGALSSRMYSVEAVLSGTFVIIEYLTAALTASGTISAATITALGHLTAALNVTGSTLTTANVGQAVWDTLIEAGIAADEVMRILLAVAAGKSAITDLGGGSAEVAFRDQADTKDRVFAEMTDSERITVTLDVTE